MEMNMKKVLSILLCIALFLSLVACTKTTSNTPGGYKAGTYTATAEGKNGEVTVEVVFDEKTIVSVEVKEHSETAGISDPAIERIPKQIVEGQTLAVDAVAGATMTSDAILIAVEDCVKQAGGDVDLLKVAVETDGDKSETTLTTDVVVVGGGGSGLAAAASAHENGAKVIVIEKLATVGGSTALSGGGISATGTRFQEELGIKDTKESWMKLWKERQNTSNPDSKYPDYDRVDKYMDEAIVTTQWMVDYMKHSYERVEGFGLDPVERIHFAENGGAGLIANMNKFVVGEGIEILTETRATELITNDKNDVVGVIAEGVNGKVIINAQKVIMATGGFAKSEELMKRFVPELADYVDLTAASAGSTGDGILMAEKLGAALYEDPWVIGLGITSRIPELAILDWDNTKVLVNGKGERFMNENSHYAVLTNAIASNMPVWMIIDSSKANAEVIASIEGKVPNDEIAVGKTVQELATAMKVSEDTLVKTMDTFNKGVTSGKDAFGKSKEMLVSTETAPYYAFKYYPKTMGTFGGVKTNENYQVLKSDGSTINNLYASGECSNRNIYNQVYMSGSAVQLALTSGRISGAHAAQAIVE